MELPAMTQSLLGAEDVDEHRFRPVVNLDIFFKNMYLYHYNHGLPSIMLTQVCGVFSLGFTVAFSSFLLGFVDWKKIMDCHDENSCKNVDHYVTNGHIGFSSLHGFFTLTYIILFGSYWIWSVITSLQIISQAIEMEVFYRDKLGITLSTLQTLRWDEVVQRLITLHEHKVYRVAVKDKLTAHDVVLRIMRKDNYMVALVNKGLLNLRLPWWAEIFVDTNTFTPSLYPTLGASQSTGGSGTHFSMVQSDMASQTPHPHHHIFLTKSLEWSINFCVLEHIFNDQFSVSSSFTKDLNGLQSRFIIVGILNILFSPFLIFFLSIQFFLQNAQQFHSNKSYLGPRQWSLYATWTFREFNELPHVFENRLHRSYLPLNEYLQLFHNPYTSMLGRVLAYISGSFVAVLLLVSVFDDAILLYIHSGEHNLLWYLGICSAIYAGSRSLVPDESKIASADHEQLMDEISACTHYYDTEWKGKCHTEKVRDDLTTFFPYKVKLFALEVCSVILTPLILCFSLPNSAERIINFIRDHSVYVDGVGAVCDYTLFNIEKYGDTNYGVVGDQSGELGVGADSKNGSHNLSSSSAYGNIKGDGPMNGKLEQSYLSFQLEHPNWRGNAAGEAMISRLNAYKANKRFEQQQDMSLSLHQSLALFGGNVYDSLSPVAAKQDATNSPEIPQRAPNMQHVGDGDRDRGVSAGDSPLAGVTDADCRPRPTNPPITSYNRSNSANNVYTSNNLRRYSNSPQIFDSYNGNVSPNKSSHYNSNSYLYNSDSGGGNNLQRIPSVLRSVLRGENIDFENDFYWMNKFHMNKRANSEECERSVQNGMMFSQMNNSQSYGAFASDPSGYKGGAYDKRRSSNSGAMEMSSSILPLFPLAENRTYRHERDMYSNGRKQIESKDNLNESEISDASGDSLHASRDNENKNNNV